MKIFNLIYGLSSKFNRHSSTLERRTLKNLSEHRLSIKSLFFSFSILPIRNGSNKNLPSGIFIWVWKYFACITLAWHTNVLLMKAMANLMYFSFVEWDWLSKINGKILFVYLLGSDEAKGSFEPRIILSLVHIVVSCGDCVLVPGFIWKIFIRMELHFCFQIPITVVHFVR